MRALIVCGLLACSSPSTPQPVSAAGSSSSDEQVIAQATLDIEGLAPYLHGRPMRVFVNKFVDTSWDLRHAGAPVEWVDGPPSDDPAKARVEFTLLRIEGDRAAAQLRYDIEGIVLHADFRRKSNSWTLTDSELAER